MQLGRTVERARSEEDRRNSRKETLSLRKRLRVVQQRHLREVGALEMKISANWTRLWAQRGKEIGTVRKQYLNAKFDADSRHRREWQRLERLDRSLPHTSEGRRRDYSY